MARSEAWLRGQARSWLVVKQVPRLTRAVRVQIGSLLTIYFTSGVQDPPGGGRSVPVAVAIVVQPSVGRSGRGSVRGDGTGDGNVCRGSSGLRHTT